MNIPDDRVLQLTQQILEMLKSMVILFQQARFQFSRMYMDHGMVHGCMAEQGDGICCIEPGSSITLFVQPFPQYLIKVGNGCGGGSVG